MKTNPALLDCRLVDLGFVVVFVVVVVVAAGVGAGGEEEEIGGERGKETCCKKDEDEFGEEEADGVNAISESTVKHVNLLLTVAELIAVILFGVVIGFERSC